VAKVSGRIADLSYRNYDGPMDPLTLRWWAIAKMTMRLSVKNRWFWICGIGAAWWYFIMGAVFYFTETIAERATSGMMGNQRPSLLQNLIWKDQFLDALNMAHLLVFIVLLIVGAGAIAADNRANALLVYLSKPCTKVDYLLGKWLGVFLLITAVYGVPALLFYGFSLLSYRSYGYWDAMLLPKLLVIIPLISAVQTSLIVGISSLFNQPRLAGATYAGVYFLSSFLSSAFSVIRHEVDRNSSFFDAMTYFSVDGLLRAITKAVLNTTGGAPFSTPMRGMEEALIPPPSLLPVLLMTAIMIVLPMLIAWRKVRAVEVVGS
jgi:ABC-2 type transport system permease protein